jgi:hypothetical protein
MAETTITTRQVKPSEVSLQFTRDLQAIAQEAWTAGLDGIRDPEEIKNAFNPNDPVLVTEARRQYKAFARHGRLIVAHSTKYGPPEAYAMTRKDVSPKAGDPLSLAVRTGKRAFAIAHDHLGIPSPQKLRNIYAWEKHVVARPDAVKGLGTAATKASLEEGFRKEWMSAAYIDDENEQSREFFGELGYEWDGNPENVKEVYRFGEENEPATQRRYIAPVGLVIANAQAKLNELDVQVRDYLDD